MALLQSLQTSVMGKVLFIGVLILALLIPLGMLLSHGESHNPADWSTRSLLGLLYLVVFGSIFGYTAYVWLVQNVSLGTVATYAYVNPLVAITLGILFLDEVITWQIAAGAAVILTSVAVVIRREVPRRPEAVIPPLVES